MCVAPATGTIESRKIHQPRQRDLSRAGAVPGGNPREHGIGGEPSRPLDASERAVGKQGNVVREAAGDHAVQDVVVLPDVQFHLDRGDLGDAPGFLDLPDVYVAETDRLDVTIALQGVERAHARCERHTRIRRVQLIEVNAIDAERAAAGLARRGQVARPAVRYPAALRTRETAFGRDAKARSVPIPGRDRASDEPFVVPGVAVIPTVRVGRVEERYASIERGVKHRQLPVRRPARAP